jgi:hypothetical protein
MEALEFGTVELDGERCRNAMEHRAALRMLRFSGSH